MPNWLSWPSGWADFLQVVGVPLALLGLLFGWLQLRKAARTARVQVLLALDQSLSDFEDIRVKVNRSELITESEDKIRLRRYIGTFERVGYALKVKETKLEIVDQFYGDRFRKLVIYLFASSYARSIVKNREGWEDFYSLWDKLLGYKKNRRKLPPVDRIKDFLDYDARIAQIAKRNHLSREKREEIIDASLKATASLDPIGEPGALSRVLEDRLPSMIQRGIPLADPDQYKKLLAETLQNRR
jgi:hypothetical protein